MTGQKPTACDSASSSPSRARRRNANGSNYPTISAGQRGFPNLTLPSHFWASSPHHPCSEPWNGSLQRSGSSYSHKMKRRTNPAKYHRLYPRPATFGVRESLPPTSSSTSSPWSEFDLQLVALIRSRTAARGVQAVAESEAACHAFLAKHGKSGVFTADSLIVFREGIPVAEYGAF
jgi:hypothetical protein